MAKVFDTAARVRRNLLKIGMIWYPLKGVDGYHTTIRAFRLPGLFLNMYNNKTEHVQTSKPRAEIIIQQDWYSMEWIFIFYNFGIYGYWMNLKIPSSKKGRIYSHF